ncbi:HypC/HybG/HupF family hydrogenase formation chaperone [Corynebacterium diphtheriae]|nr:HypC/HybG/HupF family hydrogenase formation chaperone [Corynebacterium diphtheriae]
MCLGIPARVVEVLDGPLPMAVVDMAGEQRPCSVMYVPEVQVGQFVLLQNGYAMEVLDEKSAQESLATIAEFNLMQQVQLAPREPR